jgi:hypothetical protein
VKTGRNDPCPCGSGRKYKHCCLSKDEAAARTAAGVSRQQIPGDDEVARMMLSQTGFGSMNEMDAALKRYGMFCENLPDNAPIPTFMEFLGRTGLSTEVNRKLSDEARGRDFADIDEMNRFMEGQINAMSKAPLEDFEGISSELMHRILHENFEKMSDFVEISDELPYDLAQRSEMVTKTTWLLRYIAEHGGEVRLTGRRNYPRVLCRSYLKEFDRSWKENESVPSEADLPFLFTVHDAVVAAGYTVDSPSKAMITTEGVVAITRDSQVKLFSDLLLFTLDELDWLEWQEDHLRQGHFTIIQSSALFSLYLLHRHPSGTTEDFFRRFAKAYPAYVQPANGNPGIVDFLEEQFETLFFFHFCRLFGLVRIRLANPDEPYQDKDKYEVTELFRTAFNWKM